MSDKQVAFDRWLLALSTFGDPEAVRAITREDSRVERHGWDSARGRTLETFTGPQEIAAWCARSPRNARFSLASPPEPQGDELVARYTVRIGDYENHGTWRARLHADGRIARLVHQPDDLPDEWREGVPEGKSLGPPPPGPQISPGAHDHGHDHGHDHSHEEG